MPLGKRVDFGDARYAGAEIVFPFDIVDALQQTLLSGLDFLVAPLVHARHRRPSPATHTNNSLSELKLPFTRSDLLLSSAQWSSQIVGKISPWISPDSENKRLRQDSEAALRQELEWAAHLNLQACMLPVPPTLQNANYARILLQVMHSLSSMSLWVRIPMSTAPSTSIAASAGRLQSELEDPWQIWNQIRCLCGYNSKLGIVIDVPDTPLPKEQIERLLGEPVRALVISTSTFQTNKRGYPTLSKPFQDMLHLFFQHNVQIIVTGQPHHSVSPSLAEKGGGQVAKVVENGVARLAGGQPLRIYQEYLAYLFRKPELPSPQQQLEYGYKDFLQAPLQPLQDNLESQTYETFERDTNKYTAYEEAVCAALLDRVPSSQAATRVTILMVVGAGRGPLVRAALRAALTTGRKLHVYAVEKNPNAVVTLQNLVCSERWEGLVTIVAADMRHWQAPEKADVLVSELLGSFGDNELSPECLDGAQRFLREDGISIPSAYTSYIHPVSCSKSWNDVRAYEDLKHFETPYVVKMHRFAPLAATQEVFTFNHPNRDITIDNSRSCTLEFHRKNQPAAVCHGFAGYFDATLYGKVHLSTHPPTHTPDMFSWFPIYFPLKEPVYCAAGATLHMSMWRCTALHKVWYEWAMLKPSVTSIHNPTGRSYYVGL